MTEQSISYKHIFRPLLPTMEDRVIQISSPRQLERTKYFKNLVKYIRELTKGRGLPGHSPKEAEIREVSHIWGFFYYSDICQFQTRWLRGYSAFLPISQARVTKVRVQGLSRVRAQAHPSGLDWDSEMELPPRNKGDQKQTRTSMDYSPVSRHLDRPKNINP